MSSHLFFLSSRIFVFVVLFDVCSSHTIVLRIIPHRKHSLFKSAYATDRISFQINLRKCLSDARLKETTNRLQRLKIDRRYALLTAVIAIQYLIAWTPYACIELLNLTGRSTFVERNPFYRHSAHY